MKRSLLRVALVLGLIQAIGPFAIDMYLPALPSIGPGLDAGVDAVQASLTVFFIALAMGLANLLGGYLGARTAVARGVRFVRAFFVVVVGAFVVTIGWRVLEQWR